MLLREAINGYLKATLKVIMKKSKSQKTWEQVATFSMKTSQVAERQVLTCIKLHGENKSILRGISTGSLQRCSSEVTERFLYRAYKTIPLPSRQSTEPGEVYSC